MGCGAGSIRWACALHYEQPRDRKKAVRSRCLRGSVTRETLLLFWGARPSRVLVLLSRQHELLMNSGLTKKVRRRETQRPTRETRMLPNLRGRATQSATFRISADHGPFTPLQ